MFPFQWEVKASKNDLFSSRIDLSNITYEMSGCWLRKTDINGFVNGEDWYNEHNYFYGFTHKVLYDNGDDDSLLRHFERIEPKENHVVYSIECCGRVYDLEVKSINLDIYSTGVGVLSFFLFNNNYTALEDILNINQFGRRIFPPYFASIKSREILAERISIRGLRGAEDCYSDDFSNHAYTDSNRPACFLKKLINDVATNIEIEPVIDDRMFVQCLYKNDEWADKMARSDGETGFLMSEPWYDFVFVDLNGKNLTCGNDEMRKSLVRKSTYDRWKDRGTLYGVTRFSMVCLTRSDSDEFVFNYFSTIYARMVELVLVQRASVLRFSDEVTNISNSKDNKSYSENVSSLYREYIRFINQIHFREVSAQDQGIELYKKLYHIMDIGAQSKKLEEEIEEVYSYVSLQESRDTNHTMTILTVFASLLIPMTVIASIFGMNNIWFIGDNNGQTTAWYNHGVWQFGILIGVTAISCLFIWLKINRKR